MARKRLAVLREGVWEHKLVSSNKIAAHIAVPVLYDRRWNNQAALLVCYPTNLSTGKLAIDEDLESLSEARKGVKL